MRGLLLALAFVIGVPAEALAKDAVLVKLRDRGAKPAPKAKAKPKAKATKRKAARRKPVKAKPTATPKKPKGSEVRLRPMP